MEIMENRQLFLLFRKDVLSSFVFHCLGDSHTWTKSGDKAAAANTAAVAARLDQGGFEALFIFLFLQKKSIEEGKRGVSGMPF